MTDRPIITMDTLTRPAPCEHEKAAEHGAEQHREERSHLDEAVAAEEFVLFQMLRQDRIFERAEEGGLAFR